MLLRRVLPSLGALLTVGWALVITAYVLSDEQISSDMALGIISATAIIPGFIALYVIGLLWPIIQGMVDVGGGDAAQRFSEIAKTDDLRA
jgi:hypothetical protein